MLPWILSAVIVTAQGFAQPAPLTQRVPIAPAEAPELAAVRSLSLPDLLARMPSEPWDKETKPWTLKPEAFELRRRAEQGLLTDEDWLETLRAFDVIHTRPRWPAGEPLGAWVREVFWLRLTKVTARAIAPELGEVVSNNMHPSWCGNCRGSQVARMRSLSFDPLPVDTTSLDLEVTIEQRAEPEERYTRNKETKLLWRGTVRVPVLAVAGVEDALLPTTEVEVEAAIRRSFHGNWYDAKDPRPAGLRLWLGGEHQRFPELRGVGVSLQVELWCQGTRVASELLTASQSVGFGNYKDGLRGMADFKAIEEADRSKSWELRCTGTSAGLLPVWETERYWSGSFTLPLTEVISKL